MKRFKTIFYSLLLGAAQTALADDNTNVWRSKLLASERDAAGNEQACYYKVGVGTKRFERLRGGAFGDGLDANLRDAYQWLMSVYEDDDMIYVFRPPGEDPKAILRVARLVLAEGRYRDLAEHLGLPASWPV